MPSAKRKFGDLGEKAAEEFIKGKRYRIIEKNYRVKNIGEIDIVAEKDSKLYFFEVKTRSVKHETNFPVEDSINLKKRENLRKICNLYLIARGKENMDWQVDGIFVKVDENGIFSSIEHMDNILWEKYY